MKMENRDDFEKKIKIISIFAVQIPSETCN